MKILIATLKSWNIENAKAFMLQYESLHEIRLVTSKEELTYDYVSGFKPDYIFFPHWSYIIPKSIYSEFECVVFHMTDLPFGRGGSPLQNLIVRGFKSTVVSAIRVNEDIDGGPVYMKFPLSLEGTADEIFRRSSEVIFNDMIPSFLVKRIVPVPQSGEVVSFSRRSRSDGELKPEMDMQTMYDYIRMLDAEGYPNAYICFGEYTFQFTDAVVKDGKLEAHVSIIKED